MYYYYLQQLFELLNRNENHTVIMTVYLSLVALALLLRIITCLTYRSALFAFRLDAKDMIAREDIKKIRNGMLRKIAAEFIRVAEKSVTRIPTSALVDRQVSAMSFMGWRYVSVMTFVESLENGMLLIGLILAMVFGEYAFLYGSLAVAGFVLTRIASAFFDFRAARAQLSDELLIYTEREVGRFFTADTSGAVLRLKNELADAIAKQSAVLKEAVGQIGVQLTDAADKKVADMNAVLQNAMQEWGKTLADAGRVQGLMNTSAEKMQTAGANIMSASDLLARHLQGHSNALSDQLGALVSAVEAVKEYNDRFHEAQETLLAQMQYIQRNQAVLETTVQNYEASLQNLTQSLGDGLGAYLRLHAQTASQAVNDTLTANIDKAINNNQETLLRMTDLFDQLRGQNKDVSANLLAIHEKLAQLESGDV